MNSDANSNASTPASLSRRPSSRRSTAQPGELTLDDYRDIFALYDRTGSSSVELRYLGDLLRAAGQNPTQAEVRDIAEGLGPSVAASGLDFPTFHATVMAFGAAAGAGVRRVSTPEEILQGFQVFDKDLTGTLPLQELVMVLTSIGERMTKEEVVELMKALDVSPREDGTVVYEDFVRALLPACNLSPTATAAANSASN